MKLVSEKHETYSPEWWAARKGMVTASEFHRCLSLRASTINRFKDELQSRLAGEIPRRYQNKAMEWGSTHEQQAVELCSWEIGDLLIASPGLYVHDDYFFVGASPDAVGTKDYGGEVKCPYKPENHMRYVDGINAGAPTSDWLPNPYYAQVQGNIWVYGSRCERWFFASFDPRLFDKGDSNALALAWIERDQPFIDRLERHVTRLWASLDKRETYDLDEIPTQF